MVKPVDVERLNEACLHACRRNEKLVLEFGPPRYFAFQETLNWGGCYNTVDQMEEILRRMNKPLGILI